MALESDIAALRAENARLIQLLEEHGIAWRVAPPKDAKEADRVPEPSRLTPRQKVTLFRELFRGRNDVFPLRWVGKTSDKSGYSPACSNEWVRGVCEKPRIKCGDCSNRELTPLSDKIVYEHLAGTKTIGVYPLLTDDTCTFVAVDFDEAEWREDALGFVQSCRELGVPAALEVSRSGNGAHAWVFFSTRVSARDARRLGTAIISHTCSRTRQLKLTSYDRLFPNQDTMPKGGFGNLIALPLQKHPREQGFSEFVDADLLPHADQWGYLASIERMSAADIEPTILRATGGGHPLDVTFIEEEDLAEPWKRTTPPQVKVGPLPASLTVTLSNMVYFEKSQLPQTLANRLIRLAAFQNPEFYRAQAMRHAVWDKPRVIGCADNFPLHIALPRGCLEPALDLLRENGISWDLQDERFPGTDVDFTFQGTLRDDQETALEAMLLHDTGVLSAATAFGKTVLAAALIARRKVNTLILVNRADLLRQWEAELPRMLNFAAGDLGRIGAGKKARLTGRVDIAVMQSISRGGEVESLVEEYGQVIVDECHHIGAVSFEAILRRAKARFVAGLTATPFRRDGQQAIIFMQCGAIRHRAARASNAPQDLKVIPRYRPKAFDTSVDVGIQEVFRQLTEDEDRNAAIVDDVHRAFLRGRKVLLLTERTEHLQRLGQQLLERGVAPLLLHGRMSAKQRTALMAELDSLSATAPRVLIATGKLVGEGFDHPALNTLALAHPVSWKGRLQQYAGRLHRNHSEKSDVEILDYADTGHPALMRMWQKRVAGYRSMGYRIESADQSAPTQLSLTA